MLRALTVKNPWAWALAHGGKRVENRWWSPPAGLEELAIHAGARSGWDQAAELSPLIRAAWQRYAATLPEMNAAAMPIRSDALHIDFSAIVAVATVGGWHAASRCRDAGGCLCDPWAASEQFHWEFPEVRTLARPVPCRGYQKLWTVPDEAEAAVRAQLEER